MTLGLIWFSTCFVNKVLLKLQAIMAELISYKRLEDQSGLLQKNLPTLVCYLNL